MADLQQLREFLSVYNQLTEKCFQGCVRSYNSHLLEGEEVSCVSDCIDKYMRVNRRLMLVFAQEAPKILFKQQTTTTDTQLSTTKLSETENA